jgi:hypothetical protein
MVMHRNDRDSRLIRWAHRPPGDETERRLGELFDAVADPPALSERELAHVYRRLTRGPRRRSQGAFGASLVIALVSGGAAAAVSEWVHPRWWSEIAAFVATPGAQPPRDDSPTHRSPSRALEKALEPIHAAPPPEASVIDPAAVKAAPIVEPAPSSRAQRPAAPPSEVSLESEALTRALVKLRRDHDPAAALFLLDDYAFRFPRGTLSLEAAAARVDALFLLDRRIEALSILESLPLSSMARGSELQLVRAELRAETDCVRALSDFDSAVAAPLPPALAERALYGRAACRLRTGNDAAARADLEAYLARYPSGRFAPQVRARLSPP